MRIRCAARRLGLAVALAACLAPGGARALAIALDPATIAAGAGSFEIDVVVSGLAAGTAPSLGAFELDLAWDPARLALTGVAFGSALGDPVLEAVTDVVPGAGSVNVVEVSLLAPAALDALQPDTFVLARLGFEVLSLGASATIEVTRALAADAFGRPLAVDAVAGARVEAIPEPGAAWLFALGLACAARGAGLRRA